MKNSFFVVQVGGKQHIVSIDDTIEVNHIEGKVGDMIPIDQVLLVQSDDALELGSPLAPYVATAEIINQSKGKKIDVFKYKAKARQRKMRGHRQLITTLKFVKLSKSSSSKSTTTNASVKPPAEKKTVVKKTAPKTTRVVRKALKKSTVSSKKKK